MKRLQPLVIRLYTKPQCSLCVTGKAVVQRVLQHDFPAYPYTIEPINIETDPVLWERDQYRIPVFALRVDDSAPPGEGEVELAWGRIEAAKVAAALRQHLPPHAQSPPT
eukprot:TRINITY_DN71498_c0_g1_i1.p2 TRINITY_DN71498_c0_g1~~TRINITY_DN71498_c0_g1_i1.p2  ORF type:complete len:126 (+),score=27.65 TRINITY_DN71498_c0_g1_i1:52-378(+)